MPWGLFFLALVFVCTGAGGLLSIAVPGGTFSHGDETFTYQEVLRTGLAYPWIAMSVLVVATGVGLFRGDPWARLAAVAFPLQTELPFEIASLFGAPSVRQPLGGYDWFSVAAWVALLAAYLFGVRSVRAYFSRPRSRALPDAAT
jgi:hypothetical protein